MLLLLAGCDDARDAQRAKTPGARLEAVAVKRGLVIDPARVTLTGSWARESDRVCVVGPEDGAQRIGAVIDYGEGQGCSAAGSVQRSSERLRVDFGGDCRFDARFEGERIVFPAEVPRACEALCSGRATLAALDVERLSASASEAATLRGRGGKLLCSAD